MLEIDFEDNNCSCDKLDLTEVTSAKLLQETPVSDARLKDDEIHSTAKRKTSSLGIICYNINTYILLIVGTCFLIIAFLLFRWPLFNLLTTQRLRMLPSLPPYKLWAHPDPIIYCRVHIFTVTNPEGFLSGADKKMKVMELGPIVFREHLEHRDVEFHDNSTLSYTVHRHLEFLPEMNQPGILNRTITVPNIALLGMVAKVADYMFTVKMGFNLISREDKLFVNTTVNDFLWNFTTPALQTVDKYLSFMVPMDNAGALHTVYKDFTDRVNVRIGPKYNAQEFFTINTFDYRPTVQGFQPEKGDCFADLNNSSEGAIYPNRVSKDVIIYYWRKTVCRPVALHYKEEVVIDSLMGYKYVTRKDWYDRMENLTADCYKGYGREPLPDGLSDVSKCYGGIPIAVSSPHFYGRSGYWEDKVEGFSPDYESHGSYAIIEPINGVPLDQKARSQSNIVLPKLTGFSNDVNKFSEMVIPFLWLEYHQPKLTPGIIRLLNFTSNILPRIEYVIPVIFLILGLLSYYLVIRRVNRNFSLGGYSRIKLLWRREKVHFFEGRSRGTF